MRVAVLLLILCAAPALAAAPADLAPAMWERVRATEAVVGDLAPTASPAAPTSLSLPESLALAYRNNAAFRQDQASLVNARRALWVAEQRLFSTGASDLNREREPGHTAANALSADVTTRWETLLGGSLRTVVGTGTQSLFGDLVSQRPSVAVSYDQPLLRGAGLASSTSERGRRARTAILSQELSFYDAHQELGQQIIEDYYAVLLARGEVDITQRAVDRAKQFYDRNNVMFTGEGIELPPGVEWKSRVTIMDVGQARLDWERAKQDLISAQQSYRDATDRLLLDMGLTPGATPELTTALVYRPQEYDEAALTAAALESSTELARLELSRQDAEADRRLARSEARPDLLATLGLTDLGETAGGATVSTGWFTGVRVEIPFFDRGRRESLDRADRSLQVLAQRRIAAHDRVAQEVQRQVRAAASSRARIDIGLQARDLAKQNREAAQAMFEEGLTDSLRVVDADQRYVQADRSLLQEQTNYLLATVRVRRALGEDVAEGLLSEETAPPAPADTAPSARGKGTPE